MDFNEYYQNSTIVDSYDIKRNKGVKGRIIRRLEQKFAELLLKKNAKQKILEIGVGTGFISKLLANKGEYYGIDQSKEMLKKAGETLGKAKLSKGNILILRFNKKFDTIVSVRVIGHLNKKEALTALQRVNNALKTNGEFIFNLENKSFLRRILRKIKKWGGTYTYQYSKKEICELAEKTNFKIKEIIYLDHLFILPLHLINKISFGKLENFIFKIEVKLRNFSFMTNNFFIKCEKE